ncbi:Aste57867_4365 [Aphanomyces stellatus]|uniref:Aste57867_4365 protein n=1 Tax=Aphanomyces stellatus TaxID=120398 RepID=A0A485KCP1_9STRA|nr:hypothetical protein As57867_004353 [Aphanomyces stellatus]VFT81479.1 Aste57867_4365 [Aphanomyces stellatus]
MAPPLEPLPFLARDPSFASLLLRLKNGRHDDLPAVGPYRLFPHEWLSDTVFEGHNPRRRSERIVIKLSSSDDESLFMARFNKLSVPDIFDYIVEWRDWGDVSFPQYSSSSLMAVVLERGDGSLATRLASSALGADEFGKYSVVVQLLKALRFVHDQGFVHGNVTLDHVVYLCDKYKLVDFACAVPLHTPLRPACTPESCPPELAAHLLSPENVPRPVATVQHDVWSLGVLVLRMFSPHFKLQEFSSLASDMAILEAIASPTFNGFTASLAASSLRRPQQALLARCFDRDPAQRGSLNEILDLLPRKTTMDASLKKLERQTMANQTTAVQLALYKVPCLWTLTPQAIGGSGFLARGKRLLSKSFRLSFLCEMRDECPCRLYDDEPIVVTGSSDLVMKALPVLRATAMVVKALGLVVGWGGVVGDYFNFDLSQYAAVEATVSALSTLGDISDRLELQDKLESVVEKLEGSDVELSPQDISAIMAEVKDVFVHYRDDAETYNRLLGLLQTVGYDWDSKFIVGGLVKKVVRVDESNNEATTAGEVRWVCKYHADKYKSRFVH